MLFNFKNFKSIGMNDITYYKNKENSATIKLLKKYNRYNEGNFNSYDIKLIIFDLINERNLQDLNKILKELFENYKFDRNYEFDRYFKYDETFILQLILYYKNKVVFSKKKKFKLLLIKEKEKKSNSIVNFHIKENCYNYVFKVLKIQTKLLHLYILHVLMEIQR